MKDYLDFNGMVCFFNKLKEKFATKDELSQVSYKIQVISQSDYDKLEIKDTNTLYVIEV